MSSNKKRPYVEALELANRLIAGLRPYCERIELAGSLRRGRPMIGDIEVVALPKRQKDLLGDPLPGETELDRFLASHVNLAKNGRKQKQFQYGPMTVDLFLPESLDHWGCIYTIRTGSHDFNLWLVGQAAQEAKMKFDEGRLRHRWGNREFVTTQEEAQVFEALKLPFIPVQYRDDGDWELYLQGHSDGQFDGIHNGRGEAYSDGFYAGAALAVEGR